MFRHAGVQAGLPVRSHEVMALPDPFRGGGRFCEKNRHLAFWQAELYLGSTVAATMPRLTPEEIRQRFANSHDFNELFDAFEDAIVQGIQDVELYRLLFWNTALSPEELCMFGEKLAKEFQGIAYEIYMWLAHVFEVTYSSYDNFELAVRYYQKATKVRPEESDPYLNAADCYDPDLNIPPSAVLLPWMKDGVRRVTNKKILLERLSYLYQMIGDDEQSAYYRNLADDLGRIKN
ncbi:MAG: hypothetical protein HY966_07975 [Ignavibacteriales bacterium]|nr:hypothetical protein [Ignavibacteriales bacterium]